MRALRRLAALGPVPVYAVAGAGARDAIGALRLSPVLAVVDSPRAAHVLVVAGDVGAAHADPLRRVHDGLAHPRATVAWDSPAALRLLSGAIDVGDGDPVHAIRLAFRELLDGRRPTQEALLPDEDPAPWRGIGPYGQGGSGMTGGTPYGRPLAELGPDRDGLRLDVLPVRLGPFSPLLPSGLILELRLAGDLVTDTAVLGASAAPGWTPVAPSPFVRALTEPVPIVELELARAASHLRWLADALRLHGMSSLSMRALRLATTADPASGRAVATLARTIEWSGLYRWSTPPVRDRLASGAMELALGPTTRAAGVARDERSDDPAYRALGFRPIVGDRDDVAGRWRVRLHETQAALDLATRAGTRCSTVTGSVESPRGRLTPGDPPSLRALGLIPALIEGLEWGDAMAVISSLDLDPDELAGAGRDELPVAG